MQLFPLLHVICFLGWRCRRDLNEICLFSSGSACLNNCLWNSRLVQCNSFSPLLLFLPSLHTMLASSAEDIQLWDIHCPLQPEELNSLPLQPAKQWHPLVSGPNCTKITDLAWSHSASILCILTLTK